MTERNPLVLINGQLQELPIGDTTSGSGAITIMVQEQINTATYSTTNADFTGHKFKKITQACTITVEPGATNMNALSLIPTTSGMITFVAGTGVTIISPDGLLATRVEGSPVTLFQDSDVPETYFLMGDLA